ncbi:hypothetical protein ACFL6F_02315 [Planctomycetota bacterium]
MIKRIVILIIAAGFIYVPFIQAQEGVVKQIHVKTDKAPDCSSLKSIIESVTRGAETDDQKAIAVMNFMRFNHYHLKNPFDKYGVGALKAMNVYGWRLCGGLATIQGALYRELGWKWRYSGQPGHTTIEAGYGDSWHYLDTFLRFYAWRDAPKAPGGRTIASQEDIRDNTKIATEGFVFDNARRVWYHKGDVFEWLNEDLTNWRAPSFLNCGDTLSGVVSGCKGVSISSARTGHRNTKFDVPGYSMDINLSPGYSLTFWWKAFPEGFFHPQKSGRMAYPYHTCGSKEYRNCPVAGPLLEPYARDAEGKQIDSYKRSYANGILRFQPDLSTPHFLKGLHAQDNVSLKDGALCPADTSKPGTITVRMQSPYVMVKGTVKAEGVDSIEVASGEGKHKKPFAKLEGEDLRKFIHGDFECLVKITFSKPVTKLNIEVMVMHNRCALPYLSPGKNKVTVSCADPKAFGENRLAVTYAFVKGVRSRSYAEICERDMDLAKAHYSRWKGSVQTVQKIFAQDKLPAEYDIQVSTPEGKYPAYPKMVFLRREILAPGQKPLPLPDDSREFAEVKGEVLKEMPNPFSVGFHKPPAKKTRPVVTQKVDVTHHFITMDGKPNDRFLIKWKKNNSMAWVLAVTGELKSLPEKTSDLAAVRLCVPITRGSTKAPSKIGIAALKKVPVPGEKYDFKNLGGVIATGIVPKLPASGPYNPPKIFTFDITKQIKSVIRGDAKFHGLGIRVIPDKSVDEGWSVTVTSVSPETAKSYIEIDIYKKD